MLRKYVITLKTPLAILALCLCSALSARAGTITFNTLPQPGPNTTFVGFNYTEIGFTFSSLGGLLTPNTGSGDYTGTGTLISGGGPINLVAAVASPFNVTSIDVSELNRGFFPITMTFTGLLQGGGTVTQTFVTNGVFGLDTFNLTGFTNLSSLAINSAGGATFQIDNVNVSSSTAPVPEPTTMLLLGTGLVGITAKVRKRRKAV
jgi:hypothetical protein